jgi:hypothetical protein
MPSSLTKVSIACEAGQLHLWVMQRTFESLVSVMLVHKYIVYTAQLVASSSDAQWSEDVLRWFSRGASVGGANVKLCICAVWGSSGRPVVSVGMSNSYKASPLRVDSARLNAVTVVAVRGGVVGCPLG